MSAIAKYDDAKRSLAGCTTPDKAREWIAKAEAMIRYAKAKGEEGKALKTEAERIMWHAKDRLGSLLKKMELNKGAAIKRGTKTEPRLSDLGITKKQSSEAQRVADLPAEVKREALASDNPSKAMKEGLKKYSKKPRPNADKIMAMRAAGIKTKDIAIDLGYKNERTVNATIREEEIKREAEVAIDKSALPPTAQDRLAAAMRQHQRKLDAEFEQRVSAEVLKRTEAVVQHAKEIRTYGEKLIKARKGFMDAATFKLIWSCLHPDSRESASESKLNKAFSAFEAVKHYVCDEKQIPVLEKVA